MDIARTFAIVAILGTGFPAHADPSPVGLWKTVDDRTHAPRTLVRISQRDGKLIGRIEARLDPGAKSTDTCNKCTDERRDKPIEGLEVIRGVAVQPDGQGRWEGVILDPEAGKEYRLVMKLAADGKTLDVRGYVGTPLFGRTQVWQRSE